MKKRIPWTVVFIALGAGACSDSGPRVQDVEQIGAWGHKSFPNGQLYMTNALAVDSWTGLVYIADFSPGYLVHVFSREGNFIKRWEVGSFLGGMAVASDHTIFATDMDGGRVLHLTPDGSVLKAWGARGSGQAELNGARGIAIGPDGSLYVADTGNDRIQVFDSEGNWVRSFDTPVNEYGQHMNPTSVAVDASGFVYVASLGTIKKFDKDGNWIAEWGGTGVGDGNFNGWFVLSMDGNGDIITLEQGSRVQRFAPDGTWLSTWQGSGKPSEDLDPKIAVDQATGRIYTYGLRESDVQTYEENGTFVGTVGRRVGSEPGQFLNPMAITVAADGSVLVQDGGRIQRFDAAGVYKNDWYMEGFNLWDLAGAPDGSVVEMTKSRWIQKYDVAGTMRNEHEIQGLQLSLTLDVDEQNRIWVADVSQHRVLAVNMQGEVLKSWLKAGVLSGYLWHPQEIAARNGLVAVIDGYRLTLFDEDGNFLKVLAEWSNEFERYGYVAIDDEHIYATRGEGDAVVFSMNGETVGHFRSPGSWDAGDIALGPRGEIYVLDRLGGQVVKFQKTTRGPQPVGFGER